MALQWELLTILLGDAVYEVTRALAPQHATAAFRNAKLITNLEPPGMGAFEGWLGHVVNSHHPLALAMGYYYAFFHLTVTGAVLIWMWWRRPAAYARARAVLFTLTFGALLVFWVFPVAPPRLAVPGTVDTLSLALLGGTQTATAGAAAQVASSGVSGLVNPYAAFPSLHVAWAAWCAWAVWSQLDSRRRWLVWLYPIATMTVVVGTANHYILDVLAGLVTLAIAIAIVG